MLDDKMADLRSSLAASDERKGQRSKNYTEATISEMYIYCTASFVFAQFLLCELQRQGGKNKTLL